MPNYSKVRGQQESAIVLIVLALLAARSACAQEVGTIRFDNWLYFQENTNNSERWQYRPKVFVPFNLSEGWTFTQRIDLPVYETDLIGPGNPSGKWKSDIGDWFIEEGFTSPEVAKGLALWGSVGFVFPTGGQAPFGASQYQWAPAVGAIYAVPGQPSEHSITLYPHARYYMGFQADEPNVSLTRRLDLYPTAFLGIGEGWAIGLYVENPIQHNARTDKWFVPIDSMLIKRFNKTVEFGMGVSVGIVKDFPAYDYLIDSHLTFYF